jgi:predicted MPP superfamily phosphohydrolase
VRPATVGSDRGDYHAPFHLPVCGAGDCGRGEQRNPCRLPTAVPEAAVTETATSASAAAGAADPHALRFGQVSDSHLGFQEPANTDVTGSFSRAIDQVNARGFRPEFVTHTGDLTHLSTPAQFDRVRQMLRNLRTGGVFTVPGEHDSVGDHGQKYRAAFGAGTRGDGGYAPG